MKLINIDPSSKIATVQCDCGALLSFPARDASPDFVVTQRCTTCARVIDYPTDVPKE